MSNCKVTQPQVTLHAKFIQFPWCKEIATAPFQTWLHAWTKQKFPKPVYTAGSFNLQFTLSIFHLCPKKITCIVPLCYSLLSISCLVLPVEAQQKALETLRFVRVRPPNTRHGTGKVNACRLTSVASSTIKALGTSCMSHISPGCSNW